MISDDGVWSMIYDLIPNLLFNIISVSQAVCIVVRAIAPEKNVWDWILELPVHIEGLSTPAKVTEALQALVFLSLGRVALWKIWGRGSLLVFKSFYDDYPLCVVLKHLMNSCSSPLSYQVTEDSLAAGETTKEDSGILWLQTVSDIRMAKTATPVFYCTHPSRSAPTCHGLHLKDLEIFKNRSSFKTALYHNSNHRYLAKKT